MAATTRGLEGAIETEPPSEGVSSQREIGAKEELAPLPLSREEFAPRRRSNGGRELRDSRGTGIVLDDISAADRTRIAEILRAARVFTREEIKVALELVDEALSERAGAVRAGRNAEESAFRVPHSPSDYLFLGAFTPEEVLVGYACWGPTPATDRTWDLYWIVVDPALQGAGIGTILLDEVERRLAGLHARLLIAETSSRSDYAATRRFYERRGYHEVARVRDFYAAGDDRIILVKRFLPLADRRGAESR